MADGTISVDLQLIVAGALKQAELAAKSFSKILSTPAMTPGGQQFSAQKAVADTAKITAAEQQHTKAVKETTKALTEQQKAAQRLRDIASGKISPVQPDMKIVDASVPTSAPKEKRPLTGEAARRSAATPPDIQAERDQRAAELRAERAEKRRAVVQAENFAFGQANRDKFTKWQDVPPIPPKASPKSPPLNGTLIRSLVGSIAGSTLAGPIGAGFGASAMGASGPFAIAIGAATAGLKALRMAATETAAAFERAKNLYAKTLQSGGLGQAFVTRQNILAGVLGVSEQDVMQYGMAIGVLNQKLAFATRIITDTQPALTATAWNFSVLKENLKAVWATLAEAVAPAINRILELVSAFAKLEVLSGVVKMLGKAISFAIDSLTRLVAIAEIAPAAMLLVATTLKDVVVGLALTFFDAAKALVSPMIAVMKLITTAISDAFQWLLTRVENHLAKSWIGKKMGIKGVEETGFEKTEAAFAAAKKAASGVSFQNKFDFTKTKEAASAFKDVLKAAFGSQSPYKETAPATPANINRMPSSAWEKMGMVLGMGGRTDHAAVTAHGVTKLVELTQKLVQQRITNHNDSFANPMAAMP